MRADALNLSQRRRDHTTEVMQRHVLDREQTARSLVAVAALEEASRRALPPRFIPSLLIGTGEIDRP
jgi:hypothetical protein